VEKWQCDQWVELEMSIRQSAINRRINELMKLETGDRMIVSVLSRTGTMEKFEIRKREVSGRKLTL
jgi:hypothetical protein